MATPWQFLLVILLPALSLDRQPKGILGSDHTYLRCQWRPLRVLNERAPSANNQTLLLGLVEGNAKGKLCTPIKDQVASIT